MTAPLTLGTHPSRRTFNIKTPPRIDPTLRVQALPVISRIVGVRQARQLARRIVPQPDVTADIHGQNLDGDLTRGEACTRGPPRAGHGGGWSQTVLLRVESYVPCAGESGYGGEGEEDESWKVHGDVLSNVGISRK